MDVAGYQSSSHLMGPALEVIIRLGCSAPNESTSIAGAETTALQRVLRKPPEAKARK